MTLSRPVAAIVLAAGKSQRFGSPKQLAELSGKPLLKHILDNVRRPWIDHIAVIIGANADLIKSTLSSENDLHWVFNKNWQKGMSSSIRAGITHVQNLGKTYNGILIVLGDQPGIKPEDLDLLYQKAIEYHGYCIATEYRGSPGVPAFFPGFLLPQLLSLKGDQGARKLLMDPEFPVLSVSLGNALKDIDTVQDLRDFDLE